MHQGLSHTLLTTLEQLRDEAPAHDRLVARCHRGDPFLSMAWYLNWLKHFQRPDMQPVFVRIESAGTPVAYLPLLRERFAYRGLRLPVPALRFAGNVYSPRSQPVLGTTDAAELARIFGYLAGTVLARMPWLCLSIRELPADAPGREALTAAMQAGGHRLVSRPSEGNWVYHQPGIDADGYLQQLPPALRQQIRRASRKLDALGTLDFRLVTSPLADADIQAYQHVYARSWKQPELTQHFHPDLMRLAADRGWLRLGLLTLDGRPIATQLSLVHGSVVQMVKTAYDEAYSACAPGKVLAWRMSEALMNRDRIDTIDYLKGDEPYKKQWTNLRRQSLDLDFYRRGAAGSLFHTLEERWLPWARRQERLVELKSALTRWRGRRPA